MKKNIFILGSTGSIGRNALDVIKQHDEHFSAKVLVTNVNVELLLKQIKFFNLFEQFNPQLHIVD